MSWAAVAVGAGTLIYGAVSKGAAKRKQKRLMANRPQYNVSPFAKNEISLAESELNNGGLSADAQQAYEEGMDNSLSSSLDAVLRSGGGAGDIASVLAGDQRGRMQYAILRDNARLNKVNTLINAYRGGTNEYDKQFMYNVDAPFKDQMQAVGSDIQSATNMEVSGLNTLGSGVSSYLSNRQSFKDLHDGQTPFQVSHGGMSRRDWRNRPKTAVGTAPSTFGANSVGFDIVSDGNGGWTLPSSNTVSSGFTPSGDNTNPYTWGNINIHIPSYSSGVLDVSDFTNNYGE